jgi:hypothetical protein
LVNVAGVTPRFCNFFFFIILEPASRAVKRPRANPDRKALEKKVFITLTRIVCQTSKLMAITSPDDFWG